jgi:hypothetical protein
MSIPLLIALAVIIVVLAYALGWYLRRRSELPDASLFPRRPPASRPASTARAGGREAEAVIHWLLTQAFEQTGVRVADDRLAYDRIVQAAHKALQDLKTQTAVTISLPFLTADASGPKHFEIRLTREVIQDLVRY